MSLMSQSAGQLWRWCERVIVAGALIGLAGCGSSAAPPTVFLADYLPIVDRTVSTDLVPIHGPESIEFLGNGWKALPTGQGQRRSRQTRS